MLQTLERGIRVLEWIVSHPTSATVKQTAQALNLDNNTCYRLVSTLVSLGYLTRVERGTLRPGPGFVRLWPVFLQRGGQEDLVLVASMLRDDTRESTYINIWDGEELVLVYVLDGISHLRVAGYEVGFRDVMHARASGKAVLAHLEDSELDEYLATHELTRSTPATIVDENQLRAQLEEVRIRGVAKECGELFPGVCSMSAPLFGPSGRVLGGMGISVPDSRFETGLETFRDRLLQAGQEASEILGYRGPYPKPKE